MSRRVLAVISFCLVCVGFAGAQDRTGMKIDKLTTVAKLEERSSVREAQLAILNKYGVLADPTKNPVTGKTLPVAKKIPKVVPVDETLSEEMSNSFIIGGGYNHQLVQDMPVDYVQGVFVTGFYYPVSWIGFGGEYQYGRGSKTNGVARHSLTRHVGVFGPEFSAYPSDNTRLFFHPLAGWAKERLTTRVGNASTTVEDTNVAVQLGGGLDWRLTRTFSWRVFQLDYLGIKKPGGFQNNWRVATGIAVRGH